MASFRQTTMCLIAFSIASAWSPALAHSSRRYLVFFDEFSANITPRGKDIISQAAAEALRRKPSAIRIEARANATGTPDATMKIAQTRAAVVRDTLVADGVAAALLQLVPIGQAGTTDRGVGPRRVDIIFKN